MEEDDGARDGWIRSADMADLRLENDKKSRKENNLAGSKSEKIPRRNKRREKSGHQTINTDPKDNKLTQRSQDQERRKEKIRKKIIKQGEATNFTHFLRG